MDVDLVYMWVDGRDPVWNAKRGMWMERYGMTVSRTDVETGDCRYIDHDELKYSLRSVERFAPWIRRIYIVTDNQVPGWLDTSHPKIRMVFHSEIMPSDALPCFNSSAIEFCIHNIEDLSEHFLLANDDCFFRRSVSESFFFGADGFPIVRFRPAFGKRHIGTSSYYSTQLNVQSLVRRTLGLNIRYAPHHNIDSYCRSDVAACIDFYRNYGIDATIRRKFRTDEDLQRTLLHYWAVAKHRAHVRHVGRYDNRELSFGVILRDALHGRYHSDSRCVSVRYRDYDAFFRKYDPALFCINDESAAMPEDYMRVKNLYETLFPLPSSFEKK